MHEKIRPLHRGCRKMGVQRVEQNHLHPNSWIIKEVIITVAISKWKLFRTAGEGSISRSLAGRQGAMNTLIRSTCSTRTHVCGLWTLLNHCRSSNELPAEYIDQIYHLGGTGCTQIPVIVITRHYCKGKQGQWTIKQGLSPASPEWLQNYSQKEFRVIL